MIKLEQKFQTEFNKWLKYCWKTSGKFELKITKGNTLPFARIYTHQLDALQSPKVIHKISDESRGAKPFDCFCMVDIPGYLVVQYVDISKKDFYILKVEDILYLINKGNKSLTLNDANNFAIVKSELK